MYTINDIKVTLLNKEEVKQFIKKHGEVACICYDTDEKYAEKVGLSCMKEGHTSGSRGNYFIFEMSITFPNFFQTFQFFTDVFPFRKRLPIYSNTDASLYYVKIP